MSQKKGVRRRDLERHLREMQLQGQGVHEIWFATRREIADLVIASLTDAAAVGRMYAVKDLLDGCRTSRVDCLLCGARFDARREPEVLIFMFAYASGAKAAMGNAVCEECCKLHPTMPELQAAVLAYYKANLMPEVRVLPPFHKPHAT